MPVMSISNTSVSVLRGTEVNNAGDCTDVGTPLYPHMPAALVETSQQTFDRASQTRRTLRTITCHLPAWADVDDDDTIMDERTGNYYAVEQIVQQPSLIGVPPDIILTLTERSGVYIGSDE